MGTGMEQGMKEGKSVYLYSTAGVVLPYTYSSMSGPGRGADLMTIGLVWTIGIIPIKRSTRTSPLNPSRRDRIRITSYTNPTPNPNLKLGPSTIINPTLTNPPARPSEVQDKGDPSGRKIVGPGLHRLGKPTRGRRP